jgi:hypothetical protein
MAASATPIAHSANYRKGKKKREKDIATHQVL